MPSNTVKINNSLEWIVSDSHMDKLIKYLNRHGFKRVESQLKQVKEGD